MMMLLMLIVVLATSLGVQAGQQRIKVTAELCQKLVEAESNEGIDTSNEETVVLEFTMIPVEELECQFPVHAVYVHSHLRLKRHIMSGDRVPCGWIDVYVSGDKVYDPCETELYDLTPPFIIGVVGMSGDVIVRMSITGFHKAQTCSNGELCCGMDKWINTDFYMCDTDVCMNLSVLCDGLENCADGSDEGVVCCGREGYGACEGGSGAGRLGGGVWGVAFMGVVVVGWE